MHRVVDLRHRQRLDVVEESLGVGRRLVAQDAGQRQDAGLRPDPAEERAARVLRRGDRVHRLGVLQHARPVVEQPGGVGQPDRHPLLGRPLVAQLLQPDRGAGTAAGGVDHQVGDEVARSSGDPTGLNRTPVTRLPSSLPSRFSTSVRSR